MILGVSRYSTNSEQDLTFDVGRIDNREPVGFKKNKRVSHVGLVFQWEDGDYQYMRER